MNRLAPPLIIFSAVAIALTVTGCTAQDSGPAPVPPSFEHIHGIAADPRGDDLFIATHSGIFTLTEKGTVSGPIGDHEFDAMGFTVVTDTLYASGHPGMDTSAELGSPNLGIIRSDDFGETWLPVALNGSTDFHVLTADPEGTLYGFASTEVTVLVSTDKGRTWTPGASLAAADLAATDDGLYAAAEEGLLISTDHGLTFSPVADAPTLYTLEAAPDGTLAGVGTDGSVWSQDADGVWQRLETTQGVAQAFTALSAERFVLVDDRGVVEITPDSTTVLAAAR